MIKIQVSKIIFVFFLCCIFLNNFGYFRIGQERIYQRIVRDVKVTKKKRIRSEESNSDDKVNGRYFHNKNIQTEE